MSVETFDRLCELRELLSALGLDSLIAALEDGDESLVEKALERMVAE